MKKTQTTLNQFLALSSESDSSEESEYELSKQKSALSIPDQWTRVRSRAQMKQSKVTIFDISKDFDSDKALKPVRSNSARVLSELVFDPDSWKGRSNELMFENERLSEGRLREYAKLASDVR